MDASDGPGAGQSGQPTGQPTEPTEPTGESTELIEPTDEELEAAAVACSGRVLRTPIIESDLLTAVVGRPVLLKAENLQRTGSFKVRGATAKVAALGAAAASGVVTGSAGNHGRAVAVAARDAGVPCEVFMPTTAAITKVEATRSLGATVRTEWETVDDAVAAAADRARAAGLAFIHPFDDIEVIAGQATLGREILEQVPDVGTIVLPLGGGGLASGIAVAVARSGHGARIVAVQSDACAAFVASRAAGRAVTVTPTPTIADGIAVKSPGTTTRPIVERHVAAIHQVDDDAVADAVVRLFETAKLVVEGAGAVGAAALLEGIVDVDAAPAGPVVVVLSGGNIDPGIMGDAIRSHESRVGRRLVLLARLDDRPGTLSRLLDGVADLRVNVLSIDHDREGVELPFGTTAVRLVVQTRDREHGAALLRWAASAGIDLAELAIVPRPLS